MYRQISKAELCRVCLLPSIRFERHFIRQVNAFSLRFIIADPTFCISTDNSLIDSSAIEAFLSQQYSDATRHKNRWLLMKLISYPQLQEKDVRTSWADTFIYPISVDAFLINTGRKAYTAFYTLICCPASKSYLASLNMFLTKRVLPVFRRSSIV